MMADPACSQLLMVDMQERLLPAMPDIAPVLANAALLLRAADLLSVPVTVSEQYPKGLGPTVADLANPSHITLPKTEFACHRNPAIAARLGALGRDQLLIFGVEAHVCVLQSALLAAEAGFRVAVIADAVASRSAANRDLALRRMQHAGIEILTTEMVVFELLQTSAHPAFRELSGMIRETGRSDAAG